MDPQPQKPVPPERRHNKTSKRETERKTYDAKDVKVLLLTFKFNDLDLTNETHHVEQAFQSLGYEVDPYEIEIEDSEDRLHFKLKEFLKDKNSSGLRIVYYHGHGGHDTENKFEIFR
jgi:hypothetical protein